jgi:hypothetical protein
MKLSQLINEAQAILKKEGDLELFNHDFFPIDGLSVEEADGLPKDYDMPDGMKFIIVTDCS